MPRSFSAYLQHHFPRMDPGAYWAIYEKAARQTFAPNTHILREGQVCDFIGYVERGALRTYQLIDGIEQTYYFALEEDWITSYYSFLTGRAADIYIQCLEEVELVLIPKEFLMAQYETSMAANVIGRRVTEAVYLEEYERKKDLLTLSASLMYEKLTRTRPELLQRVQLQHIASYLGIAKESLSRIRRQANQKP